MTLVALLLSGCVDPQESGGSDEATRYTGEDASRTGPYSFAGGSYDLGAMQVDDPSGRTYPVRLLGEVRYPETADGPHPVVLIAHGRHAWCEGAGAEFFSELGSAHCRGLDPVAESVPSHLGHIGIAESLASHGFVVVVPDLNDINAGDSRTLVGADGTYVPPNGDDGLTARVQVLLRLLDELDAIGGSPAAHPEPFPATLDGRIDLQRVGLVGHSRGAEAVTHAPAYASAMGHPFAGSIRAVFSIAGTPRPWMPEYPDLRVPAGIAYASLVPYCDGDVWTLGNLDIHDQQVAAGEAGPLTQFVVMGANHNFYNTMWLDDDAEGRYDDDPYCAPAGTGFGSGRMAPGEQMRYLSAYLPAFMRLHLAGDAGFARLFTGEVPVPSFACPTEEPCPGRVLVSYMPEPGRRLMLEDMSDADALVVNDLGGATTLDGFASTAWCQPDSECGVVPMAGAADRLHLEWNGSATLRTEVPPGAITLQGNGSFVFRVAVDAVDGDALPQVFVLVEDTSGANHRADVSEIGEALFVPPGTEARRAVLNQVRVPFSLWDLQATDVRALTLEFESENRGAVFLSEFAFLVD